MSSGRGCCAVTGEPGPCFARGQLLLFRCGLAFDSSNATLLDPPTYTAHPSSPAVPLARALPALLAAPPAAAIPFPRRLGTAAALLRRPGQPPPAQHTWAGRGGQARRCPPARTTSAAALHSPAPSTRIIPRSRAIGPRKRLATAPARPAAMKRQRRVAAPNAPVDWRELPDELFMVRRGRDLLRPVPSRAQPPAGPPAATRAP